jgi:ribokinase
MAARNPFGKWQMVCSKMSRQQQATGQRQLALPGRYRWLFRMITGAAQTMTRPVSIAVIGSINLDIVARVKAFPLPGETVTNAEVRRFPGGKGANQALAAHRLGARVFMVGRVGNDPVAEEALRNLRAEGVDLSYCKPLDDFATGLALITVNQAGENQIVVAPGANARFDPEQLQLPLTDAYIAQLETPLPTILKAARNHDNFF